MKVFRGCIYWLNLNPTIGTEMAKVRPAVVVSDNLMNEFGKTVVVCPITSSIHPKWRSRLIISCAWETSEISVDQIRTVSKQRIDIKVDELDATSLSELQSLISQMYAN
jgi:mRNA interferase MazF